MQTPIFMDNVINSTEQSSTERVHQNYSTARTDPKMFLRWCRNEFKARFHKDVVFVVKHDYSDVRSMVAFLDSYLTNDLRIRFGRTSAFYNQITTVVNSKSRKRDMVDARHMVARLLKDTGTTLSQIGLLLGGRDHTTVLNSLQVHEDLYETSSIYRNHYEHLKQLCINEGFIFTPDSIENYSEPAVCSAEL